VPKQIVLRDEREEREKQGGPTGRHQMKRQSLSFLASAGFSSGLAGMGGSSGTTTSSTTSNPDDSSSTKGGGRISGGDGGIGRIGAILAHKAQAGEEEGEMERLVRIEMLSPSTDKLSLALQDGSSSWSKSFGLSLGVSGEVTIPPATATTTATATATATRRRNGSGKDKEKEEESGGVVHQVGVFINAAPGVSVA